MNTEKDKLPPEIKAVIEQLQSKIKALETHVVFLTDTRMEYTNAQLQLTQTELKEQIQKSQSDLSKELQATKQELKNTKSYIDETLIGSVTAFAMEMPPKGWLACNGQAVSRTQYSKLFQKIGITFGKGDGETTFNLPDLRERFMRGWEENSRQFGSYQADQMQSHTHQDGGHSHQGNMSSGGGHYHGASTSSDGLHSHTVNTSNYSNFGDYSLRITGLAELESKLSGLESIEEYISAYLPFSSSIKGDISIVSNLSYGRTFSTNNNDSHSHNVDISSAGSHTHDLSIQTSKASLGNPVESSASTPRHGDETHPKNVALLFCIKY
jgi:microcystin-dependent protein